MRNEVSSNEYKKVLLDTFGFFDGFCRKHNLKYFMVGGTLLGAVRHGGFIPWDDDIDLGMPREDYERLKQLFNNNNLDIKYIDCYNNNDYYLPYIKICNYKIDVHERINTKLHIGAYIDIFPFDYIDETKNYKKYFNKRGLVEFLRDYKYATLKHKNIFKNLVVFGLHVLYPFSLNYVAKKRIAKANKFIAKESSKFGNLFGIYGVKEAAEYEWFSNLIELSFEGKKYFAPKGYDLYLKRIYGDYMKLPPVEKRITHHSRDIVWRN